MRQAPSLLFFLVFAACNKGAITLDVGDDTGNGACETIFVRDIQVLRKAPVWPRLLLWLGMGLTAFGILLWMATPHRPRD